jgi:hypothetical protein
MKTYTVDQLKTILGPPDTFVPSSNNHRYLRLWALAIGLPDVKVYAMTNVELTNLYHERGDQFNNGDQIQRIASEIFVKIVETVQSVQFDQQTLAEIIRAEISHILPKRLEVISSQGSITIEGPLHYQTEKVIKIASLSHPIMLVGPAGCGKTTIGQHTAQALQLPFYITSTINDTHELTGFVDGTGRYHRTPFRDAYENGGVWVADEIDAWDASALLAANSALANGYSVFPDNPLPVTRHPSFRMIATANTFGHGADRVYVGRNELDAASLDRFATINVDYDLNLEQLFAKGNMQWLEHVWAVRKEVTEKKIRHVVSSRAIIMGSSALAIGLKWDDVEETYLFKGMSTKDREKIEIDDPDDNVPF